MKMKNMNNKTTTLVLIILSVVLIPNFIQAAQLEAVAPVDLSSGEIGLDFLRLIRLISLSLFIVFVLPGLYVSNRLIIANIEPGLILSSALGRFSLGLSGVMFAATGAEFALYGLQSGLFIFLVILCHPLFWIAAGAAAFLAWLYANREIITAAVSGPGGAPHTFSPGNATNLNFVITATTNKPAHAPVASITINKVTIYGLRGGAGAGVTDITATTGLTFGGVGTPSATLTGNNIAGFPRPLTIGVSEIEFDLTCICTSGHAKNVTVKAFCR